MSARAHALADSARLRRAITRHAAAARLADAHLASGSPQADALGDRESQLLDALGAAMAETATWGDVAAVVAHAERQGLRESEPGAQVGILKLFVRALAARAIGPERAAA